MDLNLDVVSWISLATAAIAVLGIGVAHYREARRERLTDWSRAMRTLGETIERDVRG